MVASDAAVGTYSALYTCTNVNTSHSRKGIPSAHMHWDSIYDLATLGMWADPGRALSEVE
eukprot:COSAG02_NODE_5863_length_3980_cov_4.820407_3_plen_60_part_00